MLSFSSSLFPLQPVILQVRISVLSFLAGLLLAVAMTTLLLAVLVASVSLFVMHRRNKKLSNQGYKVVPDEITEL